MIKKYEIHNYLEPTPKKILLADLRKTAKKLGKDYLSMREYKEHGEFAPSTIYYAFMGWNAAIEQAGLKVKVMQKIPRDELLVNLKNVWDTLGRQPRLREMVKPLSKYSKDTYQGCFGSWTRALNAFFQYMNSGGFKAVNKFSRRKSYRKKEKIYRSITAALRFRVFKRDKFTCQGCGRSPETHPGLVLHVDHKIPRSQGGETTEDNLHTLCNLCNAGKGTETME